VQGLELTLEADIVLLKERVAIIMGSSRGIGRSIADNFAREGAHIALNGRETSEGQLEAMAKEIESFGVEVAVVKGDVGRHRQQSVSVLRPSISLVISTSS
jgi:NAD(P)-dependent dehydrogenase (short-subunit alcohol dehydrogenase family)